MDTVQVDQLFLSWVDVVEMLIFSLKIAAVHTEDDLEVKIFIRDIKLSRSEVLKLLKMANLTHHGYEREVSSKTLKRPGSSKSEFKVSTVIFAFRI